MSSLLRRRLLCFYCNKYCRNDQPGMPRVWHCPHCEAMNHLDQRGEITDPLFDEDKPVPIPQYARPGPPPPVPVMNPPTEPHFCNNCQRNQLIVSNAMAEYLPDEDDPDYEQYAATADDYRTELEDRYPQVCENCLGRVREQIRVAGYAAKTDHLQRILRDSKKARLQYNPRRLLWKYRFISFAKWTYVLSILIGVFWHALAIRAINGGDTDDIGWEACYARFRDGWEVEPGCLQGSIVQRFIQWALVADLLTLWWNPQLAQKLYRPGGRMRRLVTLWLTRVCVLAMRLAMFIYSQNIPTRDEPEQIQPFKSRHFFMIVVLLLSLYLSWKTVYNQYRVIPSLAQPIESILPISPQIANTPTAKYKPARPNSNAFDTMPQSFTSSFQGTGLHPYGPPSPTERSPTKSELPDDSSDQLANYKASFPDDRMDWTPTTTSRFSQYIPSIFSKAAPPPRQPSPLPQQAGHSLFTTPDPNPFRHKVVPMPPKPESRMDRLHKKEWSQNAWIPPLQETRRNFLNEIMRQGNKGEGGRNGAVPKKVQRDSELFKAPKLKFNDTWAPKTTGLEDKFDKLFS